MRLTLKSTILWILSTLLVYYLIVIVLFFWRGGSADELMNVTVYLLETASGSPVFYLLLVIPYLTTRFIKYLGRIRRKNGLPYMMKMLFLLLILPGTLIFGAFRGIMWYNYQEDYQYVWDSSYENVTGLSADLFEKDGKHRGIHVFFNNNEEKEIEKLIRNNVEWITLVPYTYQPDVLKPRLYFEPTEKYDRGDSMFIESIKTVRKSKLNVLMKPHIWVSGDLWRSEISMDSEADWQLWFKNYGDFILHYATIAQETGCAALCVGTELMKTALERPDDWRKLIRKVREVYDGELIYAANWDREYKEIEFWDELDYIGVQAYFGLTRQSLPTVEEICNGWKSHKKELLNFHKKWNKPILFTEVGYKSTMGAAHKPWEWESRLGSLSNRVSMETQANCYEALFRTFWNEPWFAGVHLWRWEGDHKLDFTPKNKPAANIMSKWFAREKPKANE